MPVQNQRCCSNSSSSLPQRSWNELLLLPGRLLRPQTSSQQAAATAQTTAAVSGINSCRVTAVDPVYHLPLLW